jgi:hypothetical protein
MDTVTLLTEAREAGLIVEADGETLRIRGPRRAEAVARRILAAKDDVMSALRPRRRFRFVDGPLAFGDIGAGWSPAGWVAELRRKAGRCDAYRPDIASHYRAWARDIEWRLMKGGEPSDAD